MELINIVPIANMSYIQNQTMGMFLTHLVETYPNYASFARKFNGYKILDNSLIELKGKAVSLERLFRAGVAIQADEIILPDEFQKGKETYDKAYKYLSQCKAMERRSEVKFKYMAVCHGRDIEEFEWCFRELIKLDIDAIGIPKVCATMHPKGRPYFEHLWLVSQKKAPQIHLLGIWSSFLELNHYIEPERIRSVDSSLTAVFAYNHLNPLLDARPDGFQIDLVNHDISCDDYQACIQSLENLGIRT